ncbi:response regulator transcription factor [Candidatus Sulfurimonas marisnigri]|uniref:Response regulator transcription factor n=1 Tax=Candidatus Sulfurimonas marisnigri TaxID=2740405 RepID=A0A7S7RPY6_9BACT|nr:LuxR C-terminal-related transcriptional regulator [Candidatus Sulfurimonas marisnigri]QOY53998.1 response regulator transcription factor [Candidatus Sulfurimonas marisnigri]
MKIILFSSNINTIDEWEKRHIINHADTCLDIDSLIAKLEDNQNIILIADYDSVASEINNLISSYSLPENLIVLEKVPEIATGKMLIRHGVKAYGNSRMLTHHYKQMLETVTNDNIWTYPELTAALVKTTNKESLNSDALQLIQNRLSNKELEVVYLILNGQTNDAIASALNITTRTVKAHVSSIFSKLHVNDRVSLILLLK